MTDFLQILSTKLKLRFHPNRADKNPSIEILDKAVIPMKGITGLYNLPLFKFRILRGNPEPSIYQKYGYEFIEDNEDIVSGIKWKNFAEYVKTLTPNNILGPELVAGITSNSSSNVLASVYRTKIEPAVNSIYLLYRIINDISKKDGGATFTGDTPISELLNRIDSINDARYNISEQLFKYLVRLNQDKEEFPGDYVVELKLNATSEKWAAAEAKLLITNVEEGDTIIRGAAGGAGVGVGPTEGGGGATASASGGARRRTLRRHSNKRKLRRSRGRPKLDRGWSA
jgi:hypothetical protein